MPIWMRLKNELWNLVILFISMSPDGKKFTRIAHILRKTRLFGIWYKIAFLKVTPEFQLT